LIKADKNNSLVFHHTMYKFIIVLLSVFLLSTAGVYSAGVNFSGVVSGNIGKDVFRIYTQTQSIFGFTVSGTSINGTIGSRSSINIDKTDFIFTSSNVNYLFNYFRFKGSAGAGAANVDFDLYSFNYRPTVIIEYKEINGEEGFQYGKDTILGWLKVDSLDYKITSNSKEFTSENNQNYTVTAFDVTSDIFGLRFYISGAPVAIDGNDISSGQSKIDISINNYYDSSINKKSLLCDVTSRTICASTGPSSDPQSRLALAALAINGNAKFSADVDASAIVSNTDDKDISVGLNWVGHADTVVEGRSASSTVSTSINGTVNGNIFATGNGYIFGNSQLLIHSFSQAVRPSYVLWDPTIGASPSENNSGLKVTIPSMLLIILSLIVLLL